MVELIAGLIDVFADAPLTGNPLAVVQDADGLTDDQMRRIAGEFNQAETTFLMRSTRADWKTAIIHCERCRGVRCGSQCTWGVALARREWRPRFADRGPNLSAGDR